MQTILILGANSDIAKALAHEYAEHGYHLCLAVRNSERLDEDVHDLKIRYQVEVQSLEFDAEDYASHEDFYHKLSPKPHGVIWAIGYLGDQQQAQVDFEHAEMIVRANYLGAISILNIVANDLESRKSGFIVGISSVAGDRGRQSNYIYGSAKAGLTAYLAGLRNRLYSSNVHVLTVKPGYVYTKMSSHLNLPPKLTAQPADVAKDIFQAQQKLKNILYTKWYWNFIMMIVKLIPEGIFKKLSL
ncbi:MAG: SDR family oxidoreductase [SAR324 cluster bacterium]|nr:SDR family oxidoreductase [SAR324 cluster bacterium]